MNREDMKVLVTGSKGQLGSEMMSVLNQQGIPAVGYGRSEMDVADAEQVMDIMETEHPTHVIHAGAYTKMDLAESEPDTAYRVFLQHDANRG